MANCIIMGGGGGGTLSSDVTATKANVLAGTRTVTSDSNNEVVEGTMANRGTVNHSLPINGSFVIQQGYHSGSGKVTQNITVKGTTTYYPSTTNQTIDAGQYLSGAQTISAVTQQNLIASNIKKGVTVYVKNGNGNIFAVTGTWEGYVPNPQDLYNRGTYGQYGTLRHNEQGGVSFDSAQITFNTRYLTERVVRLGMVTPVTVNMATYTRLSINGTLNIASSGSNTYVATSNIYVDLFNDIPNSTNMLDPNHSSIYYRLARKTDSAHSFTLSNPVLTWSSQNMTKYLRVLITVDVSGAYCEVFGSWLRLSLS